MTVATLPDASRDIEADLTEALAELDKAHDGYVEAQDYYDGRVEERFISDRVRRLLTGSKADFQINMAGRVVSAVLDRLEISSITAETDDNSAPVASAGPNPATELLTEAIWDRNELDLEAPEIHERAISLGDAYALVWEGDEDGTVDVFYNSPLTMRVLYDAENARVKRLAIKRWETRVDGRKVTRVNLYYPDVIVKFVSRSAKPGSRAADYTRFSDEYTNADGEIPNPYDEVPVFHFRTARPYGKPEHQQAYGAQDAITKLVANQMINSDFAAFPQRYGLVDPAGSGADSDDWGDETGSDPGERKSQYIAGPGRLWLLENLKAIGQFAAADVDQLLKPLTFYIGAMAGITGTPVSYFALGDVAINTRSSGEAQRQDKDPLTKKIEARQRLLGATWRDLFAFGLKILGVEAKVHLSWQALQTVSGKDGWQGVQEQQKAGVPVRQALLETGYTADQCDRWGYTEEHPDGEPAPSPLAPPAQPPQPGQPPVPPTLPPPAPGA